MPSSLLVAASSLFLAGAYLSFGEAARLRGRKLLAGSDGEDRVGQALDEAGGMDRLGGLLVESRPGRSAMIDHVVKGRDRLVVVETKNWTGAVSGGRSDREWTQARASGEAKVHRNPILQSRRQAKVLSDLVRVPVAALVVMAGRSRPASGEYPEGAVSISGLAASLPPLMRGPHPVGRCPPDELDAAWAALVALSEAPGAEERLFRAGEEAEARYGRREWVGWTAMAIAAAGAASTVAPVAGAAVSP